MNPSTALAAAIVDELVLGGVRHVVLCPGSRSAPFAYAVLAAERAGRLRLHVRVDERSAGFLALGLAKVSRVPAAVVTTSGTAVANLHPAVLEAHHGGVPLVVVSADRPVPLRESGANQTTRQPGIFGVATRWDCDLVVAPGDPGSAVARGRLAVADALTAAVTGHPGPVHLNVPLAEPLVPADPADPDEVWDGLAGSDHRVGGSRRRSGLPGTVLPDPDTRHDTDEGPRRPEIPLPPRTLVVLGDLPDPQDGARALAWAAGRALPVVAEPFGTHPRPAVVPHGVLVLGAPGFVDEHAPDAVVVIGRPTLSRPVTALLRRPTLRLVLVTAGATFAVPAHPHAEVVPLDALDVFALDASVPDAAAARAAWQQTWHRAGAVVEAELDTAPAPWPSGLALARTVAAALPPDAVLFVGSSKAVRDLDAVAAPRTDALTVIGSRGLAGIDGCVATAIGIALADPERPTYALVGDLTLLHDANALAIGPAEPRPDLTVVVPNDRGGGIFHLLEPGEPQRAADFERVFGTPTGTDLGALCAAHGVGHVVATTAEELRAELVERPRGLRVVEVVLDRQGHRGAQAGLASRVAAALSSR